MNGWDREVDFVIVNATGERPEANWTGSSCLYLWAGLLGLSYWSVEPRPMDAPVTIIIFSLFSVVVYFSQLKLGTKWLQYVKYIIIISYLGNDFRLDKIVLAKQNYVNSGSNFAKFTTNSSTNQRRTQKRGPQSQLLEGLSDRICNWTSPTKFRSSLLGLPVVRAMELYEGGCELKLLETLEGHSDRVWSLSWNPATGAAGVPLVFASCSGDKTVRIWEHTPSLSASWTCKVCSVLL